MKREDEEQCFPAQRKESGASGAGERWLAGWLAGCVAGMSSTDEL